MLTCNKAKSHPVSLIPKQSKGAWVGKEWSGDKGNTFERENIAFKAF